MDLDPRTETSRMEDLESRLRELEAGGRRSRQWFRSIVPAEATRHFRAAGREQLLGMRALVDHWIARMEDGDRNRESRVGREEITIE
jgi:hypothetical protein